MLLSMLEMVTQLILVEVFGKIPKSHLQFVNLFTMEVDLLVLVNHLVINSRVISYSWLI